MNITTQIELLIRALQYENQPNYFTIAQALHDITGCNIYITDLTGNVFGFCREALANNVDDGVLDKDRLSKWVLDSCVAEDNVQPRAFRKNVQIYHVHITDGARNYGFLILTKLNGLVSQYEYLLTKMVGVILAQYLNIENRMQKIQDAYDSSMVDRVLPTLTFLEHEGAMAALHELVNGEGVINHKRLSKQINITAVHIKKGLAKLNDAGLISMQPCYRCSTYIKIESRMLKERIMSLAAEKQELQID